jgi:hypothetical protein
MSLPPDQILVPYGVDTWSIQTVKARRFGDGSIQLGAPFPCAVVNKAAGKPLRLNSEALNAAPNFNVLRGTTPLNLIKERLKGFCRPWDRLSLQFLDGYFAHIINMLDVHQDAIATKLAPFVGLYAAEDWAFSAPKPLPRAHLHEPRDEVNPRWDVDDFVQADFAFWLGDRMVAVLSQPRVLMPTRAAERLARLEQAGVGVVHFNAENLTRDFGTGVIPLESFGKKPNPSRPARALAYHSSNVSCRSSGGHRIFNSSQCSGLNQARVYFTGVSFIVVLSGFGRAAFVMFLPTVWAMLWVMAVYLVLRLVACHRRRAEYAAERAQFLQNSSARPT